MSDLPTVPDKPKDLQSLLQWFAAHPLMGLAGSVASIIGLPLGLYFFFASQTSRELVISSDPATTIVNAGEASSIDFLYHGEKIKTDVYARHLYLWNAGNDSIRRENILEPITISIPHSTILETRVRKLSRHLTAITVDSSGGDTATVSWNILEHNDGAYIDIIYAAQEVSRLVVHGSIEHQRNLEWGEYGRPITGDDTEVARKIVGVLCILFGFSWIGVYIGMVGWYRRGGRTQRGSLVLTIVVLLATLGGAIFITGKGFLILRTSFIPPFF